MSFRILVLSPLHQTGATVASVLLAQALTYLNKTVTLAYTRPKSYLTKYISANQINDPTRSIMQVVRLIDCNALKDEDILGYTVPFAKNANLMSFGDTSLTLDNMFHIVDHVYRRVPTDMVIVDCSDDIDSPVTEKLIETSNMVFLVVSPSLKILERMKQWRANTKLANYENVFVLVNHYDGVIMSLRDMAKMIGLPASYVCKIHENPWIRKMCINGTLQEIVPYVKGLDPRVANLSCDLEELTQCVASTAIIQARLD